MRVISKPALRDFWEKHADAEAALTAWWSVASGADWKAPADILEHFPSADTVGGELIVFDIRRNDYRLIVTVDFTHSIVFIYGVYTRADYDRLDLPAIAERLKTERAEVRARRATKSDPESTGKKTRKRRRREEGPMSTAIKVPAGLAGYAALISEFPLRPIRDADEHARALAVVRSLMGGGLDEGEADYLEILVGLIERYEEMACPMAQSSDAEMLRFLLESRGATQTTLARETGLAESAISEVLSGKKALRRQHIGAIAACFRVSPAVFRFDSPTGAREEARRSARPTSRGGAA